MSNATTKLSSRPPQGGARRTPSSRPPRGVTQLDEALADAAKMARRVDQILDEDPFAAAVLAREYLSQVQDRSVNPLNQQGSTDAWTSSFVRLRVASNVLEKDPRRTDGEAYVAARTEERRLLGLYGSSPRARLTAVRGDARTKRRRMRALRLAAWLTIGAALIVVVAASVVDLLWLTGVASGAGAIVAAACLVAARAAGRAGRVAAERAAELERGFADFAAFETSDRGRALLQRLQSEHPLLVRLPATEGSPSNAPPASGARAK